MSAVVQTVNSSVIYFVLSRFVWKFFFVVRKLNGSYLQRHLSRLAVQF